MVAFASSPAGRHYLSSMVDIESDPLVLEANQSLSDEMLSVIDDIRKEGCAERAAAKLAMGDTKAACPLAKGGDERSL